MVMSGWIGVNSTLWYNFFFNLMPMISSHNIDFNRNADACLSADKCESSVYRSANYLLLSTLLNSKSSCRSHKCGFTVFALFESISHLYWQRHPPPALVKIPQFDLDLRKRWQHILRRAKTKQLNM